jgi:hypothetical protein
MQMMSRKKRWEEKHAASFFFVVEAWMNEFVFAPRFYVDFGRTVAPCMRATAAMYSVGK